MSVNAVVVNYGCPRSGTTFMRHILKRLSGVFAFKLAEGRVLHPCQSGDGLVELHKILRHKRLVLVRTVRHPLELAESFVALRDPRLHEAGGVPENLAKFSDERAVEFVRLESENTARQRAALLDPPYVHEGFDERARHRNVRRAQDVAQWLDHQGQRVCVALIAPSRYQREAFKHEAGTHEVYLHTTELRGKEDRFADDYEPPEHNHLDLDTGALSVAECAQAIMAFVQSGADNDAR